MDRPHRPSRWHPGILHARKHNERASSWVFLFLHDLNTHMDTLHYMFSFSQTAVDESWRIECAWRAYFDLLVSNSSMLYSDTCDSPQRFPGAWRMIANIFKTSCFQCVRAEFHFHSPSEHTIDGLAAEAELHLVHKSLSGSLTWVIDC